MATLKFYGEIKEILPAQQGTTQTGKEWYSQGIIVEELGTNYPDKAHFILFGKALTESNTKHITPGNQVTISFNINMREFEPSNGGRGFRTELRVWKIEEGNTITDNKQAAEPSNETFTPTFAQIPSNEQTDLFPL